MGINPYGSLSISLPFRSVPDRSPPCHNGSTLAWLQVCLSGCDVLCHYPDPHCSPHQPPRLPDAAWLPYFSDSTGCRYYFSSAPNSSCDWTKEELVGDSDGADTSSARECARCRCSMCNHTRRIRECGDTSVDDLHWNSGFPVMHLIEYSHIR